MKEISVAKLISAVCRAISKRIDISEEIQEVLEGYIYDYGEAKDWDFVYFDSNELYMFCQQYGTEEVDEDVFREYEEYDKLEATVPAIFCQVHSKMVFAYAPHIDFVLGD